MSSPAFIFPAVLRSAYLTPSTIAIQVGVSPPFSWGSNIRKRTFWNLLFTRRSTSSIRALLSSSIVNSCFSKSACCWANSFSRANISAFFAAFFSMVARILSFCFTSSKRAVSSRFLAVSSVVSAAGISEMVADISAIRASISFHSGKSSGIMSVDTVTSGLAAISASKSCNFFAYSAFLAAIASIRSESWASNSCNRAFFSAIRWFSVLPSSVIRASSRALASSNLARAFSLAIASIRKTLASEHKVSYIGQIRPSVLTLYSSAFRVFHSSRLASTLADKSAISEVSVLIV